MPRPWPSGPLDAAQRAFDLLTCPPAPLAFDGRGFTGLPPRLLPLDELKKTLIADRTPRPVRDTCGGSWWSAPAGTARPGCSPPPG